MAATAPSGNGKRMNPREMPSGTPFDSLLAVLNDQFGITPALRQENLERQGRKDGDAKDTITHHKVVSAIAPEITIPLESTSLKGTIQSFEIVRNSIKGLPVQLILHILKPADNILITVSYSVILENGEFHLKYLSSTEEEWRSTTEKDKKELMRRLLFRSEEVSNEAILYLCRANEIEFRLSDDQERHLKEYKRSINVVDGKPTLKLKVKRHVGLSRHICFRRRSFSIVCSGMEITCDSDIKPSRIELSGLFVTHMTDLRYKAWKGTFEVGEKGGNYYIVLADERVDRDVVYPEDINRSRYTYQGELHDGKLEQAIGQALESMGRINEIDQFNWAEQQDRLVNYDQKVTDINADELRVELKVKNRQKISELFTFTKREVGDISCLLLTVTLDKNYEPKKLRIVGLCKDNFPEEELPKGWDPEDESGTPWDGEFAIRRDRRGYYAKLVREIWNNEDFY